MENGQGMIRVGQDGMDFDRRRMGAVFSSQRPVSSPLTNGNFERGWESAMRVKRQEGWGNGQVGAEIRDGIGARGESWQNEGVVKNTETDVNRQERSGFAGERMGMTLGEGFNLGSNGMSNVGLDGAPNMSGQGTPSAGFQEVSGMGFRADEGHGIMNSGGRMDVRESEVMEVAEKRGRELAEGVKQLTGKAESPKDIMMQAMMMRGAKNGMGRN